GTTASRAGLRAPAPTLRPPPPPACPDPRLWAGGWGRTNEGPGGPTGRPPGTPRTRHKARLPPDGGRVAAGQARGRPVASRRQRDQPAPGPAVDAQRGAPARVGGGPPSGRRGGASAWNKPRSRGLVPVGLNDVKSFSTMSYVLKSADSVGKTAVYLGGVWR